ncbi:hypothetical protein K435DRAFT_799329 [Dendrothele bispora CBS 962.96]|uniref:Uncharacterized protein n=1 Tax=Dendrothele bispora (strain CBS 962.96) TaxID=1314807 RepID=A0A4V4HF74_DENBC|nr:hypothetical protein K435DRAFT_799329 [Dendrothele bispora CBS 962.96]
MSTIQQVQTRTTQEEGQGDESPRTPFHTFTPQGQWINNRRNESTLGSAVPLSGLGRTLGEHRGDQTTQDQDQDQPDTPSRPVSAPPVGHPNSPSRRTHRVQPQPPVPMSPTSRAIQVPVEERDFLINELRRARETMENFISTTRVPQSIAEEVAREERSEYTFPFGGTSIPSTIINPPPAYNSVGVHQVDWDNTNTIVHRPPPPENVPLRFQSPRTSVSNQNVPRELVALPVTPHQNPRYGRIPNLRDPREYRRAYEEAMGSATISRTIPPYEYSNNRLPVNFTTYRGNDDNTIADSTLPGMDMDRRTSTSTDQRLYEDPNEFVHYLGIRCREFERRLGIPNVNQLNDERAMRIIRHLVDVREVDLPFEMVQLLREPPYRRELHRLYALTMHPNLLQIIPSMQLTTREEGSELRAPMPEHAMQQRSELIPENEELIREGTQMYNQITRRTISEERAYRELRNILVERGPSRETTRSASLRMVNNEPIRPETTLRPENPTPYRGANEEIESSNQTTIRHSRIGENQPVEQGRVNEDLESRGEGPSQLLPETPQPETVQTEHRPSQISFTTLTNFSTPSQPLLRPGEVRQGGYRYTPWYGPRGRGQAYYRPPRSLQQYQEDVERNQRTRETSNEPLAENSGLRTSATTGAEPHRNQQEPSGTSDNRTESGYQADTSGNINTSGESTTFYPHQRVNQPLPRSEKAKGKQPE